MEETGRGRREFIFRTTMRTGRELPFLRSRAGTGRQEGMGRAPAGAMAGVAPFVFLSPLYGQQKNLALK